MDVNIIVAISKNNGIGYKNTIPWYIKSDLQKFKKLTTYNSNNTNNAIIMGKNTYESINNLPIKYLSKRDNLILSSSLNIDKEINNDIIKSFSNIELLENYIKFKKYENIWIIGGEKIYNYFLNEYNNNILNINDIYITYIDKYIECDSYFPKIDTQKYKLISKNKHIYNNNNYEIYDIIYKKERNIFNIFKRDKYI